MQQLDRMNNLAEQIVERVAETIVTSVQTIRSQSSLSFSQVVVVMLLGRTGPTRLGQIAVNLGITSGSATPLVDGLEARGLVQRRPDPDDRRAILVELSDYGRELVDTCRVSWSAFLSELLERVRPETVEDLVQALESVGILDGREAAGV